MDIMFLIKNKFYVIGSAIHLCVLHRLWQYHKNLKLCNLIPPKWTIAQSTKRKNKLLHNPKFFHFELKSFIYLSSMTVIQHIIYLMYDIKKIKLYYNSNL
jgi:hypothetical protein